MSVFTFFWKNGSNQSDLYFQLIVIVLSNIISAPCIFVLIFVHWKKGPEWWLKISPTIFFILLFAAFLILPALNVIISIVFICDPKYDIRAQPIESYVVFFMVLYMIRIIEFFTWIRKSIFDDAMIYLQNRNNSSEDKDLDQLRQELFLIQQKEASGNFTVKSRSATLKE